MPARHTAPAIADNSLMRLVDSHCHLQADHFQGDVDEVIAAARLAGVERILVPGWDPASSAGAVELAGRVPWLDAAVGVHPHEAARVDATGWAEVVALAAEPSVVAIGETGLDFDRLFAPVEDQLANLRRNLRLAAETGKPAILHCRSASGSRDAQDRLGAEVRHLGSDRPRLVVHSYSGPLDYAAAMLELGAVLSFSGLVFRPGEEQSASVARLAASDCLLVETDAPFLSPPGAPRRRNAPEWVRLTAAAVAAFRGDDPDALGVALVDAYDRLFPRGERS